MSRKGKQIRHCGSRAVTPECSNEILAIVGSFKGTHLWELTWSFIENENNLGKLNVNAQTQKFPKQSWESKSEILNLSLWVDSLK